MPLAAVNVTAKPSPMRTAISCLCIVLAALDQVSAHWDVEHREFQPVITRSGISMTTGVEHITRRVHRIHLIHLMRVFIEHCSESFTFTITFCTCIPLTFTLYPHDPFLNDMWARGGAAWKNTTPAVTFRLESNQVALNKAQHQPMTSSDGKTGKDVFSSSAWQEPS
ncbi:hypothetical protein EDD15DRAFT_825253 [Pisolithus albus]|nr:hypothetical protein EDD15DRAFT_825253 [Pisolithus albus]